MQADDVAVGDEAEIARGIEEQFWLGMHGVERLLRQCAVQLAGAARERGECRRPEDRNADVGEAVLAAPPAAPRKSDAMAQRQPVRGPPPPPPPPFQRSHDVVFGWEIK